MPDWVIKLLAVAGGLALSAGLGLLVIRPLYHRFLNRSKLD